MKKTSQEKEQFCKKCFRELRNCVCENKEFELKTLKDLKHYRRDFILNAINEKELKAEAVKWVKLCHKDLQKTDNNDREAVMFLNGELFAFEHFFNLTSEDLK